MYLPRSGSTVVGGAPLGDGASAVEDDDCPAVTGDAGGSIAVSFGSMDDMGTGSGCHPIWC